MILSGGMSVGNGIQFGPTAVTDPYFANVVLLLHGDGTNGGTTFTDSSSYARSPSSTQNITTSSDQTLFGQNTIKSLGGTGGSQSVLNYASSTDFTLSDTFTLEFWIYQSSGQSYGFGQTTFLGSTGSGYYTNFGGYGPGAYSLSFANWTTNPGVQPGVTVIYEDTWYYVVVQQSGANYATYLNGVRKSNLNDGVLSPPVAARPLGITSAASGTFGFQGYIAELRYTQGVARYSGATIPVQSAPWPNS